MNEFAELEYKYKADSVGLSQFLELMSELNPLERLDISSWDYYYTKDDSEDFVRFRASDTPELTKKVKTKQANNWSRVEVDLPLDPDRLSSSTVKKFLELEGYTKETQLYKSCFIFWLENVNYVYYIVYDKDMKELGRFVEVEVNKDKVHYLRNLHYDDRNNTGPADGAVEYLNEQEKVLSRIGITPQNRMKKSLFELYVK